MNTSLGIVILAAGQGTRMRSQIPKVLHPLAGKPLLGHVLDAAKSLNPQTIVVVYGHGGEQVKANFPDTAIQWVEQTQLLGTGHAVQQALPQLQGVEQVLVLYGDVPLINTATLQQLIEASIANAALGLITIKLPDPTGYGRIIRDVTGSILKNVEQKDATSNELAVDEINTGIMTAQRSQLESWLGRINNQNAQGEFYLTDCIALAVADGVKIVSAQPHCTEEILGINDRLQLARLERHVQQNNAKALMRAGVTICDPARFDLRGTLQIGIDVTIDINAIIEGTVVIGDGVKIGSNCLLRNCSLGAGTQVYANSIIEDASIADSVRIGPFARIRPGTKLAAGVHVGNFVEIKNSQIGPGSKANHLTYLGDSNIGSGVNIGAGTITCNYDGANKHQTVIGDRAFIGSNAALIAPVQIGPGATIGAGSVITQDAPDDKLTITRSAQKVIEDWQRPQKSS
jgi:bifunctional UDP-N-acetylglucosamine pyrophosphorylase/glucosamine-1-phosphate N-acetyltransferase